MKTKILILLIFTAFFSCSVNNEPSINPNNLLLGNWTNAKYNGAETTFERVHKLPEEAYGVSFKEENSVIERSSGFCGTPPLVFFNTEGTFSIQEDVITIKFNRYPGTHNWRVISLNNEKLVVKREVTSQEEDHQKLMDLYDEIEKLSQSVTCTNGNTWSFTAYGAKACGGPQGYIAYSNQINTVVFLQKVAKYTEAEKEYNTKWGIISTCDIPAQPKSVECKNGAPVFKY